MIDHELDYAVRQAQNMFDEWNNKTNAIPKRREWYPEILGIIEKSVKMGVNIFQKGIDFELLNEEDNK